VPRPPDFGRADASRVEKPWGYELHWAVTDRYVGKVIHINRGEALSLQYHRLKDEFQYVVKGSVEVEIGDSDAQLTKHRMQAGDTLHITPGTRHRLTALEDSDIFEVSTPEMDDVIRLEDRYGRAGT
jgi:quercetin dioxygenase-like cupin family protein